MEVPSDFGAGCRPLVEVREAPRQRVLDALPYGIRERDYGFSGFWPLALEPFHR